MPVAYKPNATFETGKVSADTLSINDYTFEPIELDENLFDDILDLINKKDKLEREHNENIKKNEKLQLHINAAKEAVSKAEEKRTALIDIIEKLKDRIDKKQQTINESLQYWRDKYGIDVKQISTDEDNFKIYEFQYSKLPKSKRIQLQQSENNDTDTLSNDDNSSEQFNYKISLKHHENKLTIVGQEPELIKAEEIEEFNNELTQSCISLSDNSSIVDYKLAVLKIKKVILKSP